MSKERAKARAAREAAAAQRAAASAAERARLVARRQRRARRELLWRRTRLWQHGSGFRRTKERWAALVIVLFVVLLLTYFLTGSLGAVGVALLVAIIALPALSVFVLDRRSP